jgi:hypothetical protein
VPVVSIIILEFSPSTRIALARAYPIATWTPSVTSITSFLNSAVCAIRSSGVGLLEASKDVVSEQLKIMRKNGIKKKGFHIKNYIS